MKEGETLTVVSVKGRDVVVKDAEGNTTTLVNDSPVLVVGEVHPVLAKLAQEEFEIPNCRPHSYNGAKVTVGKTLEVVQSFDHGYDGEEFTRSFSFCVDTFDGVEYLTESCGKLAPVADYNKCLSEVNDLLSCEPEG